MKLKSDMEALEREYHYFLGQTDMLDLIRVMNGMSAESEWLCYGELAYRYDVEDMLTLLKQ